ncbi:Tetratricopeptide repeat protein [Symmachiella dynata]|uniref:tetratricopeptide repeat protein n=1 Tax=Symmachiella dynata TaxID=2527995 RepID=UPI00118C826A|nr:hypothetical protein [Symmachiella dynata]QDT48774.1 Tetratricopeptide repeat protein [Symmachiella dynata]
MKFFIAGAALAVCALTAATAQAQPGKTYPKVYGASGGLYGPTQAHYQYARRYGRAWTGGSNTSGRRHHHGHHHHRGGFGGRGYYGGPGFYGGYGYSRSYGYLGGYGLYGGTYGGYYGYSAISYPVVAPIFNSVQWNPTVIQGQPLIMGADPFDNEVLKQDQQIANLQQLKNALMPAANAPVVVAVKKSNGAAKQRSLHQQGLGDVAFLQQKYSKAYSHYRSATKVAPDLTDNYFRMAWALVAMGHEASAVREIKRGLRLDPYWPLTGVSLDERFGPQNEIGKDAVLLKTAQWVREDIRDPDRLFLMGVLLHFNDDIDRALKFFETASQLAGAPQYVQLFLHPQTPPQDADAAGGDPAAGQDPPIAPPQQQPAPALPPGQPPLPPAPMPEPAQLPANEAAASGPVLPVIE